MKNTTKPYSNEETHRLNEHENIITINIWMQKDNSGFYIADTKITIAPDLSERYGFNDEYKGRRVTALDALVATHIAVYGDENLSDYLAIGKIGNVEMAFGSESKGFMYFVNGTAHGDGVYIEDPAMGGASQTGYLVTQASLNDNDDLLFVLLQDPSGLGYKDNFAWFEADGRKISFLEVNAEEEFELVLKGYSAWYVNSDSQWQNSKAGNLKGARIVKLIIYSDSGGAKTGIFDKEQGLGVTGENGKITLKFDNVGTYILSAYEQEGNYYPIAPRLFLTVGGSVSKSVDKTFGACSGMNGQLIDGIVKKPQNCGFGSAM